MSTCVKHIQNIHVKHMCIFTHVSQRINLCSTRVVLNMCLTHVDIFPVFGDVTITGKKLQSLTYTKHLWPLSRNLYSLCETIPDTDKEFFFIFLEFVDVVFGLELFSSHSRILHLYGDVTITGEGVQSLTCT